MKKLLSLCVSLLFVIIPDAVSLKLIAGDRSVVKKDGATHKISKYYIVPNDFDPNNAIKNSEVSQKATLRMNNEGYSKSFHSRTVNGDINKDMAGDDDGYKVLKLRAGSNDEYDGIGESSESTEYKKVAKSVTREEILDGAETENHEASGKNLDFHKKLGSTRVRFRKRKFLIPNNLNVRGSDEYNHISSLKTSKLYHNGITKDSMSNPTILVSRNITKYSNYLPSTKHKVVSKYQVVKGKAVGFHPISDQDGLDNLPETLYQSGGRSLVKNDGKILLGTQPRLTTTIHTVKQEIMHPYTYVVNPETSSYEPDSQEVLVKKESNINLETSMENAHQVTSRGKKKVVYNNPLSGYHKSMFSSSKKHSKEINEPSNSSLKHNNYVTSTYGTSNVVFPSDTETSPDELTDQQNDLVDLESNKDIRSTLLPRNTFSTKYQTIFGHAAVQQGSQSRVLLSNVKSNTKKSLLRYKPASIYSSSSTRAHTSSENLNFMNQHKGHNNYDFKNDLNLNQQTNLGKDLTSKFIQYAKLQKNYNEPDQVDEERQEKYPGLISESVQQKPEYTEAGVEKEYVKSNFNPDTQMDPQLSIIPLESEYPDILNDQNNLTPFGQHTNQQQPGLEEFNGEYVHNKEERVRGYVEPNIVSDAETNEPKSAYGQDAAQKKQRPWINPMVQHTLGFAGEEYASLISKSAQKNPEFTQAEIVKDYDKPFFIPERQTNPHLIDRQERLSVIPIESEYPDSLNDHNNLTPNFGQQTYQQQPDLVSNDKYLNNYTGLKYGDKYGGYVEPNLVSGTESNEPNIIPEPSESEYTNTRSKYDDMNPAYGQDSFEQQQQPRSIPSVQHRPGFTGKATDDDKKISLRTGDPHPEPLYFSKATTHSEYRNIPSDNRPLPNEHNTFQQQQRSRSISTVQHNLGFAEATDYDKRIPRNIERLNRQRVNISKATSHLGYTTIPGAYYIRPFDNEQDTFQQQQQLRSIPTVQHNPGVATDYDKRILSHIGDSHLHSLSISDTTAHAEHTHTPSAYDNRLLINREDALQHQQRLHRILRVQNHPEITEVPIALDERISLRMENPEPSIYFSKATAHAKYTKTHNKYDNVNLAYGQDASQTQRLKTHRNPTVQHYAGHSKVATNYGGNIPFHFGDPGLQPIYISKATAQAEFTNAPSAYDKRPLVNGQESFQQQSQPGWNPTVPNYPGYTEAATDYNPQPLYISQATAQAEYTHINSAYDNRPLANGQDTPQPQPGWDPTVPNYPGYTETAADYNTKFPLHNGVPHPQPFYISQATAQAEYTHIPSVYDNVPFANGQDTFQQQTQPGWNPTVLNYSEYTETTSDYNNKIPLHIEVPHPRPFYVAQATAQAEYTHIPSGYNDGTFDYGKDFTHPNLPKIPDRPIYSETTDLTNDYNNLENVNGIINPYEVIDNVSPSVITHVSPYQTEQLNYVNQLKLIPSYQLFTLNNLLKMYEAVIKTIEINGYDINNRALINLKKIIEIILIMGKHFGKTEGYNAWYQKLFYNTNYDRHPLQLYVYNLLRQRWLHQLMYLLQKNNFNIKILQNPTLFPFLQTWKFPNNVLDFLESEKVIKNSYSGVNLLKELNLQNGHGLQNQFAIKTFDDTFGETSIDLNNFVANNVVNSYISPFNGAFSLAGVKTKLDANAVLNILQKYILYQSLVLKQIKVIVLRNKLLMLNQIVLCLKRKGYDDVTIANLIRSLFSMIYSVEGNRCQSYFFNTNLARNMYAIILSILRRSVL